LIARYLTLSFCLATLTNAQSLPSPQQFAGFPIGSDGNLVRWERIVDYFAQLDRASDRIEVEELGKTTNGNPFFVAKISSAQNIARLAEIQRTQRRIADPRGLTADEAEEIAWNSPAVVMISGNIHATEIGASQLALELGYYLATDDSPATRQILDNVVLLLVPSLNPDGQIIVTDWNDRIRGSDHRWAPLPWLYHPYAGHDNNRDAYIMTQVESRYTNKLLFQDWFPQVYLDQHQQGNSGMRVFVPPFRNPINPNVDPAIWSEIGQLGFAMYQRLHEAGFTGVGYDQTYTAWWQGGFLRGAWFHNMAGMLTEVASANLAMPVMQQLAELGQPPQNPQTWEEWENARETDLDAPLPPPHDVMPRYDYPRPWLGGRWSLRNIIDAEWALTKALLETAANERVKLIETQIRLGREAIDTGRKGGPWAFVFAHDQHDPGALYRLLEALHYCGVEVERAVKPFSAAGRDYPAGSYVIKMAQPFRAYAKDLLEPQAHPDPALMPSGTIGDQPYDLTAWSLPLQMGVETVRVDEPFTLESERVAEIPRPQSALSNAKDAKGFLIDPEPNSLSIFLNRLLKAGVRPSVLTAEAVAGDKRHAAGSVWIPGIGVSRVRQFAQGLGLTIQGLADKPQGPSVVLKTPRTALYRPWTASIDEGWTRWLLEKYEFPFSSVRDDDIRSGGLREKWDVIVLPGDRDDRRLIEGNRRMSMPVEYRGGLGIAGSAELQKFVAGGGTLVVWGNAVQFARKTFALPLTDGLEGLPAGEFSAPGSFLRIEVDNRQPLAFGMRSEAVAVFDNDGAMEFSPDVRGADLTVAARYPAADLLASGWLRGEQRLAGHVAAARIRYKQGSIVLIGFRPQFRAQPDNTFKLLFNAIHFAGIEP
jgi:hypothetical protein